MDEDGSQQRLYVREGLKAHKGNKTQKNQGQMGCSKQLRFTNVWNIGLPMMLIIGPMNCAFGGQPAWKDGDYLSSLSFGNIQNISVSGLDFTLAIFTDPLLIPGLLGETMPPATPSSS